MKQSWHYYEAHINLGNMTEAQEEKLQSFLEIINFKTTDIVAMPYEGLEQEEFYKIITTKDSNLRALTSRIENAVSLLQYKGYQVQRYKIESTIFDSKFEDKLDLLRA